MSEMIDRVTQAIWQAHKDNLSLRMHEIYPLLARAAIEAMRESSMAREQALEQLSQYEKGDDIEIAHINADEVLCNLLIALGYADVVEKWAAIPKWYA